MLPITHLLRLMMTLKIGQRSDEELSLERLKAINNRYSYALGSWGTITADGLDPRQQMGRIAEISDRYLEALTGIGIQPTDDTTLALRTNELAAINGRYLQTLIEAGTA